MTKHIYESAIENGFFTVRDTVNDWVVFIEPDIGYFEGIEAEDASIQEVHRFIGKAKALYNKYKTQQQLNDNEF